MTQRKHRYLEELARIQDQVNQLFEQSFLGSGFEPAEGFPPGMWVPAVDVVESDDAYILRAELPGVSREDIQVKAEERRLEISGRRRPLEEGQNFLRMESNYGPFRRIFELGPDADCDRVTATFERGLLTVQVPKRSHSATSIPIAEGG